LRDTRLGIAIIVERPGSVAPSADLIRFASAGRLHDKFTAAALTFSFSDVLFRH
jgi:hypothetical protein